jgi:hypothetical protein
LGCQGCAAVSRLRNGGFKGFSRFVGSGNKELGGHTRDKLFKGVIALTLELDVLSELVLPTVLAQEVKGLGKACQDLKQDYFLPVVGI